jgi:hypothetical protein
MMDARFVPAQAAIIADDAAELERLVRADTSLATARSRCDHPSIEIEASPPEKLSNLETRKIGQQFWNGRAVNRRLLCQGA